MIEISFWTGILCFTAVWLLVRVIVWIKNKKVDLKREALLLLMYVNLAVIIRFTFYPFSMVDGRIQPLLFDPNSAFPFRINEIPFTNLFDYPTKKEILINLIGNSAMFIPTGIILPILYKKLDRFWKVILCGALISLTIEIIQLPFYVRVSDVNDLILNTVGVAAGYGIYALCRKLFKRKNHRRES
ncbi:MAG: VanZ family protein [Ruminococcus sp.]|nr:VanZ family protein [Ruminococcus sp.]